MSRIRCDHVEVHLFRRRRGRVEFLAFRRLPNQRLGGVWQPVTGTRRRGETAFAAARRETREETGLEPIRWWRLEQPTVFFDPRADAIAMLPVFVAQLDARARITLSREHDRVAALGAAAAGRRYLWDTQRAALAAIQRQILRGGALAHALEIPLRP
jgi:dATP pyrophosphohydrolase